MQNIRRLLVGLVVGLVTSEFMIWLIRALQTGAGDGVSVAELGSSGGLIVAGIVIGGCYALLFQPMRGIHPENLMMGLVLGLLVWILLAVSIYPSLSDSIPVWSAATVADRIPQLIFYLLQGSLVGLIYGLIYSVLAERFRLAPSHAAHATPPITTRVVILGGGYAGVSTAQVLEERLADQPQVAICLVSQTNYLLHTPMLSEISGGAVDSQHISPSLRSFFRRVQVVQGTVERVDLAQRTVRLMPDPRSTDRELPFDHLVLALGGVPNFFGNQAVEAEAFTFKSLEEAVLLRNQVIDMFERADFEEDEEKRRRMLTFVVVGGGFAGVELIGALNDFAHGILPYYANVPVDELRLILVHSRDTILPELSAGLGNYAREKLTERGIEFKLGVRVTGAAPGAVLLGEEKISTQTFVWTAGNKPNPVLETLGLPLTQRGQLAVNSELAVPDVSGLWAAGDCAQIPDLATGKFCPPTAQHALREGKVIGYNIAASIKGKKLKPFHFKTLGSLAVLGHQLAVAEIMGHRFSGFLAWLMWRGIYLSKLPGLDKQLRVGLDWFLDIFFPPDIVQTIDFSRPGAIQRVQARQRQTVDDMG